MAERAGADFALALVGFHSKVAALQIPERVAFQLKAMDVSRVGS